MDANRRSFLKKGAGAGLLTLLMRGPLGRMAVRLSPRAIGWGGLRFSTNAVRAALPHPVARAAVEAVIAASATAAALKGAAAARTSVATHAVLNYSTAAVRSQLPHPMPIV